MVFGQILKNLIPAIIPSERLLKTFLFESLGLVIFLFSLQMVQMPGCTCTMCKDCFKGNFQVVMKEKPVKHFRCPTCLIPDIANLDEQSFYTTIFAGLVSCFITSTQLGLIASCSIVDNKCIFRSKSTLKRSTMINA